MLIRISLIVAIVAALAAGTLNVIYVRDHLNTVIAQRNDERDKKIAALADLSATKNKLAKTEETLKQTQSELADTKTQRDRAIATAAAQAKRADELTAKLAQATQERDDALNQLASYKATGLTPEQVLALNKNLKQANDKIEALNEEKAVLARKLNRTQIELSKFMDPDAFVKLRADLKGKIIVVDPKWDFVVLDIGEDQGVISDGELLVSREGKLVAKVIVRSVQKDRSIANLVPGWKLGDPIEGDTVTPAHPAS